MTTLFTTVLDGMEDNNKVNKAQFSDWDSAEDAISVYGENFVGECDDDEMAATKSALEKIISSNGEKYEEAVHEWNLVVWGTQFANNSGAAPFRG